MLKSYENKLAFDKNAVGKGESAVRSVESVDDKKRIEPETHLFCAIANFSLRGT